MVEFVDFALSCDQRSDICLILKAIAEATDCYGAVLWELDPDTRLQDADARLFTAGHWFRSGKLFAAHDLLVSRSMVGSVMRSNELLTSHKLGERATAHSQKALDFYQHHDLRSCRIAPILVKDGVRAALALYRQRADQDFPPGTEQVEEFCDLLPGLQQSLHHKVSYRLVGRVKDLLQGTFDRKEPGDVLYSACLEIQEGLGIVEASVFVEDPEDRPGMYSLAASGFPAFTPHTSYSASGPGLTSWAINTGKPVSVWDLRDWAVEAERRIVEARYPGLIWRDPRWAFELAVKAFDAKAQPAAFYAAPLLSEGKLLGVLRISVVRTPPYYFTTRERDVVSVIASQIAQYWTRYLSRRAMIEENEAWTKLVRALDQLSYSVNSELKKESPRVMNVLRKGLENTADLIPGGQIADIRLANEKRTELFFALVHGEGWTDERRSMRFSLAKASGSYGSEVFNSKSGDSKLIADIDRNVSYRKVFPEAKWLLVVPIRSQDKTYGVLDIRSTLRRPFGRHSIQLAELLGQQLGLYYALVESFAELRRTQVELSKTNETTTSAFADWQHQIRGPVNQASLRIQELLRHEFGSATTIPPKYLLVQRGLLAKAHRAARSLRLFQDLAKSQALRIVESSVTPGDLVKRLIESCLDNRILASHRRRVEFEVQDASFNILGARSVRADTDLLDQAMNNVIDNAFKYSYAGKMIQIHGVASLESFRLVVSNEGIPLTESDVANVARRGWRAEKAKAVVGEGSGIGLWVVKHIMEAHGGRLEVHPTDVQGRTSVDLVFPWS